MDSRVQASSVIGRSFELQAAWKVVHARPLDHKIDGYSFLNNSLLRINSMVVILAL